MGRNILAVIVAIIVGSVIVYAVEQIGHLIYPLPEGMDPMNPEDLKEYIATAPIGAMFMVILAHFLGAFSSGIIVTIIGKSSLKTLAIISGGIFTVFGLINVFMIPGPLWFAVVDTLSYIPAAFLGYLLVRPKN